MVWASRWSVALRTFYRQILCYIVLFSSETSAPGSPGNYLYILIYIYIQVAKVSIQGLAFHGQKTNCCTACRLVCRKRGSRLYKFFFRCLSIYPLYFPWDVCKISNFRCMNITCKKTPWTNKLKIKSSHLQLKGVPHALPNINPIHI